MKFNKEINNYWFSEDYYWGVIKRYSDNVLLLYIQDINQFYVYTGFKCETWKEIQEYIKNHR